MQVSDDRFAVSFLIALGLHAFVVLGLGFVLDFKPLKHPLETLDVVLVNWRSEKAPDKADFLAQAAQQGGGESKEAVPPVMKHAGVAPAPLKGEDARDQQEQPARAAPAARQQVQIETRDAPSRPQETREQQPPLPTAATLRREGLAMARLETGIPRDQDTSAKLPRRKWISANTREYEYAAYMRAWVAKVERVGNLNYPEEVRRKKLVGDLVMTVGINRDGSVESIDITRSSGLPELDQAARRIVRLAAPYSPLPDNIKKSVDVLHITRTWRFSRDFRGLN